MATPSVCVRNFSLNLNQFLVRRNSIISRTLFGGSSVFLWRSASFLRNCFMIIRVSSMGTFQWEHLCIRVRHIKRHKNFLLFYLQCPYIFWKDIRILRMPSFLVHVFTQDVCNKFRDVSCTMAFLRYDWSHRCFLFVNFKQPIEAGYWRVSLCRHFCLCFFR